MATKNVNSLPAWINEALQSAAGDGVTNKRQCIRHYYTALLSAAVCDAPDGPNIDVRAFNISATGIGLICRRPVQQGCLLRIRPVDDADETVTVQVMHCTQTIQGYKIGCLFV